MTSFSRRLAAVVAAVGAVMITSGPALGQDAQTGDDAGAAIIVDSVNTARELDEFDSTTAFRLRLPEGASCPGDTANDDYVVQTFLVPADTDLASLKYNDRSPDGNDLLYRPLRFVNGESSVQVPTNQNGGPGQPGLIVEPALPFTFAFYRENSLPPGRWKLGVACTPLGWVVDRFWDVEVELESAPEVIPGGLRITVLDDEGSVAVETSDDDPSVIPILVGAALLIAVLVVVIRRSNKKPSVPATKEYQ